CHLDGLFQRVVSAAIGKRVRGNIQYAHDNGFLPHMDASSMSKVPFFRHSEMFLYHSPCHFSLQRGCNQPRLKSFCEGRYSSLDDCMPCLWQQKANFLLVLERGART